MTSDVMNLQDDIFEGVVASPDDYQDQAGFSLLPEGRYNLKVNAYGVDRDQEGAIRNPAAPTFILNEIEVVDGDLAGRKAFFIRVRSNSYERPAGSGVRASELGDLMRALDRTYDWQNRVTLADEMLARAVQTGMVFKARLRWSAFDSAHWNNEGGSDLPKDEQKVLGKACRLDGMKKFPTDSKGNYLPQWVGPSGETVDARIAVAQYFPSGS
jgi:hypothetical protein